MTVYQVNNNVVDVNNADVNILDYKKVGFDQFLIVVMWVYENSL